MSPTLPVNRAFLVWMSDETDLGTQTFSGRVEHVETGRRAKFSSYQDLTAFVTSILEEESAATAGDTAKGGEQ